MSSRETLRSAQELARKLNHEELTTLASTVSALLAKNGDGNKGRNAGLIDEISRTRFHPPKGFPAVEETIRQDRQSR